MSHDTDSGQNRADPKLQQPKAGGRRPGIPNAVHFLFRKQEKSVGLRNDFAAGMPNDWCAFESQTEFIMSMGVPIDQVIGRHGAT